VDSNCTTTDFTLKLILGAGAAYYMPRKKAASLCNLPSNQKGPADAFGRPLLNLRISVTDRCNLRCRYCMPEEEYGWLSREKLLSFRRISELAGILHRSRHREGALDRR